MSVASFGQIMPIQGFMLNLAGFGPSEIPGQKDLVLPEDIAERAVNIRAGMDRLVELTGENHGVSLSDWHEALLASEKFSLQYRFARSWPAVEQAIQMQIIAADRSVVEKLTLTR